MSASTRSIADSLDESLEKFLREREAAKELKQTSKERIPTPQFIRQGVHQLKQVATLIYRLDLVNPKLKMGVEDLKRILSMIHKDTREIIAGLPKESGQKQFPFKQYMQIGIADIYKSLGKTIPEELKQDSKDTVEYVLTKTKEEVRSKLVDLTKMIIADLSGPLIEARLHHSDIYFIQNISRISHDSGKMYAFLKPRHELASLGQRMLVHTPPQMLTSQNSSVKRFHKR